MFARLSWQNGQTEIMQFADIDESATPGAVWKCTPWGRPDDRVGLAGVVNWLSKRYQAFLTAGGQGVGLGEVDGRKVHGFEAGAKFWFQKPFAKISEEQYLSLLAMMIKPNALPPGSPENIERVGRIEKYLAGACARRGFSDVALESCKV